MDRSVKKKYRCHLIKIFKQLQGKTLKMLRDKKKEQNKIVNIFEQGC